MTLRRWSIALGLAVTAAVVIVVLVNVAGFLQHWMSLHTGTAHGGPDVFYNFWSGFGSDLGEVTLIAAVVSSAIVVYRHHECHNETCHRLAHHATKSGHKLCKRCITKPRSTLTLHEIHPDHL